MKDLAAIETLPLGTYWPVFIGGKKKEEEEGGGEIKKKLFSSLRGGGKHKTCHIHQVKPPERHLQNTPKA